MSGPSSSMRELARRLLAVGHPGSDPHDDDAAEVLEKLRISLTRFAGPEAFAVLLRRALTLASADVPSLKGVRLGADGRLDGMERTDAATGTDAARADGEAAVAVAGHLLGLLDTFIGEPLTLRLVREAWPDLSLDGYDSTSEGKR